MLKILEMSSSLTNIAPNRSAFIMQLAFWVKYKELGHVSDPSSQPSPSRTVQRKTDIHANHNFPVKTEVGTAGSPKCNQKNLKISNFLSHVNISYFYYYSLLPN